MDIKNEISDIIQSKQTDNDKLWQLMRLLQKFPDFIDEVLEKEISEVIRKLEIKIKQEIENIPKVKSIKGDRGDSIKGEKGDRGDNYILTEKDKKEIVSKIKVPVKVIERTEVIKDRPIINNIIEEKAITDKPQEIAKKLNSLKEIVNPSVIQGLEKQLGELESLKKRPILRGGGASTFKQLSDVPSSYSGESGKSLRVKTTEDGLEFFTGSGSIDWGEIGGTLASQTDLITYLSTAYQPIGSYLTSETDPLSLHLNQSTPQSVINGAPVFSAGLAGGSTSQLSIDTSGNLTTTGTLGAGAITGTSIIKSGGLTTQFLKANGDVDSSTYLTTETDPVVAGKTGIIKAASGTIGTVSVSAPLDYTTGTLSIPVATSFANGYMSSTMAGYLDQAVKTTSSPTFRGLTLNTDIINFEGYETIYFSGGKFWFDKIGLATLPPIYANNTAAIAGGLAVGSIYRSGADPDILAIVH